MSSTRTSLVALPSGAVVTLRPLRAEELNLITKMGSRGAKRANTERYDGLVRALQNCTLAVDSPGPFATFSWSATSDADQMAGIFALRALTFGATIDHKMECDECDHRWVAAPRLTPKSDGGDLSIVPTSDEGRQALAGAGRLPPFKLPSGALVVCRMLAGAARKEVSKVLEELGDDPIIAGLSSRIVGMTTASGDEVEANDLPRAIRDMDAADVPELQDYLSTVDGGVDDWFPVECPECGCVNEVRTFPFLGAAAFWGFRGSSRKRR